MIPATIVPACIIPSTIIPVVPSVVPAAPVRSLSIVSVTISVSVRGAAVRPRSIIRRPVKKWDRNWQTEHKVNTGLRRRCRDKSQSGDDQQEDKKLLHNKNIGRTSCQFDQT